MAIAADLFTTLKDEMEKLIGTEIKISLYKILFT